jgi:hypothetical protein
MEDFEEFVEIIMEEWCVEALEKEIWHLLGKGCMRTRIWRPDCLG